VTGALAHDLAVLAYQSGVAPREWLGLSEAEFERLFGGEVYEAALSIHRERINEESTTR
jgi:hypothetical protein